VPFFETQCSVNFRERSSRGLCNSLGCFSHAKIDIELTNIAFWVSCIFCSVDYAVTCRAISIRRVCSIV